MTLGPDDFAPFFAEVHGHVPFPWQQRLLREIIAREDQWPEVLDLPTGTGKTAALDIALFHLALEAERGAARRAPVRVAFVVDRRLVVDDAFARAEKLAHALDRPPSGSIAERVADRLRTLSGDGPPLIARRLRGGLPREDDWARTPAQPTLLCSTVDQVGSRLLFRGYGVSPSMKPVHAGLLGADCLLLLDEAHLAEPFRQTLDWIKVYQGPRWREEEQAAPLRVALLTATPGQNQRDAFQLGDEDWVHPILEKRLNASKRARLVAPAKAKREAREAADNGDGNDEGEETESTDKDLLRRAARIVDEVRNARAHFEEAENGASAPAIGVVVNRVARARAVFEALRKEFKEKSTNETIAEPILMIGPARAVDRDKLAKQLEPIRTRAWRDGERRALDKPLLLVATQCLEAGVDIDLDALITEAAPLDALRQRFGRLNRAGRAVTPYAAVVASSFDDITRNEDRIYGGAVKRTWAWLTDVAKWEGEDHVLDFGVKVLKAREERDGPPPGETLAPKPDAPVLLPAHLDLLSQTSPLPNADPDVALYLHGPKRQPDSITLVWRADLNPETLPDQDTRRLLTLVPPRSAEAIELPLWAVRRWLAQHQDLGDLADVASPDPDGKSRETGSGGRRVFRWTGDHERSRWITSSELRPGDTIVVPASHGGLDEFGWNPGSKKSMADLGQDAARPFARRRFAVRVAPGLIDSRGEEASAAEKEFVSEAALADALARRASDRWRDVRAALLDLPLPETLRDDLQALDDAKKGNVVTYLDLYGHDDQDRPRGVVFAAPLGLKKPLNRQEGKQTREEKEEHPSATEDDVAGSLPGFSLTLEEHGQDVSGKAEVFARACGLPESRVQDLKLAGLLHDAGKADPRFQAWLHYGDPLGWDETEILAKSARPLPRRAREASGLPENWRHEALSVRLAREGRHLGDAHDPELVLWLVGAHHGFGRPLFPHQDPEEKAPNVGPQSLAFDWRGLDWPSLFARLKARYGVWELARLEAILRLADHRASEESAAKEDRQ